MNSRFRKCRMRSHNGNPVVTAGCGVAFSLKGLWPRLEAERANVNALNPGSASDMGASITVLGVKITLERTF